MVICSHIEVLTKLPKVESIGEVKKLRSLCDTVESNVRGLEGMEISSEMYGCFLTPIVPQKLPEEFRIAITRNLESETWNLKDILVEFHKELQLREQCLVNNKDSPVPELSFLPAPYRGWTRAGERRVQDNLHAHAQNEPIKNY